MSDQLPSKISARKGWMSTIYYHGVVSAWQF